MFSEMLKVQFSLLCISTFINNKNSRYDTVIGMYLLFLHLSLFSIYV